MSKSVIITRPPNWIRGNKSLMMTREFENAFACYLLHEGIGARQGKNTKLTPADLHPYLKDQHDRWKETTADMLNTAKFTLVKNLWQQLNTTRKDKAKIEDLMELNREESDPVDKSSKTITVEEESDGEDDQS